MLKNGYVVSLLCVTVVFFIISDYMWQKNPLVYVYQPAFSTCDVSRLSHVWIACFWIMSLSYSCIWHETSFNNSPNCASSYTFDLPPCSLSSTSTSPVLNLLNYSPQVLFTYISWRFLHVKEVNRSSHNCRTKILVLSQMFNLTICRFTSYNINYNLLVGQLYPTTDT